MNPLNGIHHISAITADATKNLDFYAGVMGLRLVKKTVNQDNPAVYHLFYADEDGSPGADLTFFEYPGLVRGRAGAGMIHRIALRVGSTQALDFWAKRLAAAGIESARDEGRLSFEDPEGLGLELLSGPTSDAPLVARHDGIPEEFALQGFAGVRAFTHRPERSRELLEPTPGFASDEPKEHLGERLSLPPAFEHLRAQVEANLTPLPNPREVSLNVPLSPSGTRWGGEP